VSTKIHQVKTKMWVSKFGCFFMSIKVPRGK